MTCYVPLGSILSPGPVINVKDFAKILAWPSLIDLATQHHSVDGVLITDQIN